MAQKRLIFGSNAVEREASIDLGAFKVAQVYTQDQTLVGSKRKRPASPSSEPERVKSSWNNFPEMGRFVPTKSMVDTAILWATLRKIVDNQEIMKNNNHLPTFGEPVEEMGNIDYDMDVQHFETSEEPTLQPLALLQPLTPPCFSFNEKEDRSSLLDSFGLEEFDDIIA
eukprot:TRINITY_DN13586_c0_g1_i1.p1 TRINITY_DN13586_c0_g1~~TRINITY_DN13586_c0_g1_i1.p1  ORF type:complete len:190 (-),score=39.38 TRINITY_DN13586_c0_g1_i1:110-616(-)